MKSWAGRRPPAPRLSARSGAIGAVSAIAMFVRCRIMPSRGCGAGTMTRFTASWRAWDCASSSPRAATRRRPPITRPTSSSPWEASPPPADFWSGTTQGIEVGEGQADDPLGLPGGNAEQSEEVLGDLIGGLGVVTFGVVVEELAETGRGAGDDDERQLRVGDGEPPGTNARLDVAQRPGARPRPEPAMASPLLRKTLLMSGLRRWKRPKSRKLWAKTSAGSSMSAVSSSRRPPSRSRTSSTAASKSSSLLWKWL